MSITSIRFDNEDALSKLDRSQLEKMAEAGDVVTECQRLLDKANSNIVAQCLAHRAPFMNLIITRPVMFMTGKPIRNITITRTGPKGASTDIFIPFCGQKACLRD